MTKKAMKERAKYWLDKIDAVFLTGYTALTGETWVKVFGPTGALIPELAVLALWTLALFAFWGLVGYLKGKIEEL